MQSRIVLALSSRARGDDPKAVGFKQHAENVTKSLVVLDQEDHMHRIGHPDILIDHGGIRPSELLGQLGEHSAARPILRRELADAGAGAQKIDAIE